MLNGAFALLERSLRIDSRAWSTHLARLGLMGAIYFSLCFALLTASMRGAPGLHFFQGIAYLDATFMTLLGIGFFSTAITEEKEEDTLGLMLMAGISPLGILVGKAGGRLWQSLLLVAIQYPFVLLAVTMGGVMGSQVWAMTVAQLAYMIFLAGFGLLCSTLAPRGQAAAFWMIVGLILYFVVPTIASELSSAHATWLIKQGGARSTPTVWWTFLEGLTEVCIFLEIGRILTSGFGETAWSIQVITNALAGILCAGLSWLLFGMATRNPATESTSRGLVSRHRTMWLLSAGRASSNPFVWKDFHFVSGGTGMILVRTAYFAGLAWAALVLEDLAASSPASNSSSLSGWSDFCSFLIWFSVAIDAGRVLSRSMQDEVRGLTLASLMMLPRSLIAIVYSKFTGAMIGWLPGPLIGFAVILISPQMQKNLQDLLSHEHGMVFLMLTLLFAAIPHFAALLSLYVRWGAVALATGITIGLIFLIEMSQGLLFLLISPTGGMGPGTQNLFMAGVSCVLITLCVACHIGVVLRVKSLAAK